MRIDRVDIINVHNPFNHPFTTSFTSFVNRDALLIKVYSEGLVGWGECKAFYGPFYNPEDNGTVLHVLSFLLFYTRILQDLQSLLKGLSISRVIVWLRLLLKMLYGNC